MRQCESWIRTLSRLRGGVVANVHANSTQKEQCNPFSFICNHCNRIFTIFVVVHLLNSMIHFHSITTEWVFQFGKLALQAAAWPQFCPAHIEFNLGLNAEIQIWYNSTSYFFYFHCQIRLILSITLS